MLRQAEDRIRQENSPKESFNPIDIQHLIQRPFNKECKEN